MLTNLRFKEKVKKDFFCSSCKSFRKVSLEICMPNVYLKDVVYLPKSDFLFDFWPDSICW